MQQGPRELLPEEVNAMIPLDVKELRELSLAVFSTELGKKWLSKMKDYYIMKQAVASPAWGMPYVRFREGQNSLLRAIEIFAEEEKLFCQYMSQQLLGQGK